MRGPTQTEAAVERLTAWVGSVPSLLTHSVVFFAAFGAAALGYIDWSMMLLILTTIVSLEAIYLSIFIQMTVNRQGREIHEVSEDVEDIQENIEEIQEDVEEISEDVEEISEDVEEIAESDDWSLGGGDAATMEELQKELAAILAKIETLQKK